MFGRTIIGLLFGVVLQGSPADAQEQQPSHITITYPQALALARQQSPALAAARARVNEAASHISAASIRRFNPQVSSAMGPRFRADDRTMDASVSVQQWLELGGQRRLRGDVARAQTTVAQEQGRDIQRRLLQHVSENFIAALYWQGRVALAQDNLRIAEKIAEVAMRRHEVGDVGGLESSMAAFSVEAARNEIARARAALAAHEGQLQALLGLSRAEKIRCEGELRALELPLWEGVDAPDKLNERPDLRATEAEIQQTDATVKLAQAARIPNISLGARYGYEETEHIMQGQLQVAIPVFDRGQGTTTVAKAKRQRLQTELDVARSTATVEAEAAKSSAMLLRAATKAFEQNGLATLERAEKLATLSYEAGAIPLGELLALRRELMEAKREYLTLLFDAANAHVNWAAIMGVL